MNDLSRANCKRKRDEGEDTLVAEAYLESRRKRRCTSFPAIFSERLPTELLQEILSYLDFVQLAGVARVCRRWKEACYDPHVCSQIDFSLLKSSPRDERVLAVILNRWSRLRVLRISKAKSLTFRGLVSLLPLVDTTLEELCLPAVEVNVDSVEERQQSQSLLNPFPNLRLLELNGGLVTGSVVGSLSLYQPHLRTLALRSSEWTREDLRPLSQLSQLQELEIRYSSDDLFDPSVLLPMRNLHSLSLLQAMGDLPLAVDDHTEAELVRTLQKVLQRLPCLEHFSLYDNLELEHSWAVTFNRMPMLRSLSLRSFWYDQSFWSTLQVLKAATPSGPIAPVQATVPVPAAELSSDDADDTQASGIKKLRIEFEYAKDLVDFVHSYMPSRLPSAASQSLSMLLNSADGKSSSSASASSLDLVDLFEKATQSVAAQYTNSCTANRPTVELIYVPGVGDDDDDCIVDEHNNFVDCNQERQDKEATTTLADMEIDCLATTTTPEEPEPLSGVPVSYDVLMAIATVSRAASRGLGWSTTGMRDLVRRQFAAAAITTLG